MCSHPPWPCSPGSPSLPPPALPALPAGSAHEQLVAGRTGRRARETVAIHRRGQLAGSMRAATCTVQPHHAGGKSDKHRFSARRWLGSCVWTVLGTLLGWTTWVNRANAGLPSMPLPPSALSPPTILPHRVVCCAVPVPVPAGARRRTPVGAIHPSTAYTARAAWPRSFIPRKRQQCAQTVSQGGVG